MRRAPAVLSMLLAACASAPLAPASTSTATPEIAQIPASSSLSLPAAPSSDPAAPLAASVTTAPTAPPPIPPGTAVLHVGDSFAVAGFAQALRPHMAALGVRYQVRAETSSFTTTWSTKMERMVANTQPDLVIVNLGANEFNVSHPERHAPAIRRIVKSIGSRPCVWVSPPSWRQSTGITEVIRLNTAPCRFFDSDALVKTPIARQKDKIHPSDAGGAIWAEAFWSWLNEQRAPAEAGGTPGNPWRLLPAPPDEHRAAILPAP